MDSRQARVFLAVADTGSLSAAAAVLHLTQQAVSQVVRQLERTARTPLFHRGRTLVLTPAGRAMVEPARRLSRDMALASAAVAAAQGEVTGSVSVAAFGNALDHLVDVIALSRRRYPDLRLTVEEVANFDELLTAVRDGRFDLGLGYRDEPDAAQTPTPRDVEVRRVGDDEVCLLLPPGTALSFEGPIPLDALPDLPVIATPRAATSRHVVEKVLRLSGSRPRLAVTTAHRNMQIPLVLAGVGMAWTTRRAAQSALAENAVIRGIDPAIRLELGLIRRRDADAPGVQAVTALLIEAAD